MEAFHVDESLVTVAATASPSRKDVTEAERRQHIVALPREACDEWLLRMARGEEAHLSLVFQRYLLSGLESEASIKGQRMVGKLLALAEAEAERMRRQLTAEVEARRIRELEALAPKAEEMWKFAEQLIEQGTSRSYDEALQLLVKLHQLAIHQGQDADCKARLHRIRVTFSRRKGMLERLDKAGLP
jgi:hypothetical protein